MRAFTFLSLTILATSLGASVLLYAQDEKPQGEPNTKQEEPKKPDDAKTTHQQDETKPAKQDKEDEKVQNQDEKGVKKQGQEEQQHGQQTGNAHSAGKGGHIPDDKFRAHFGRSHAFKAHTVIVSGQPQFQYNGYTFEFVEAWPAGWAYTDDCYIDYIDGEYFLFDLLHPGIRIAVFVVM